MKATFLTKVSEKEEQKKTPFEEKKTMELLEKCSNTRGPKQIVLTLDGGGVRLIFALELCRFIAEHTSRPLSQSFSLLAGTSAGAMVVTLISLGFFDDKTQNKAMCEAFYDTFEEIFQKPNATGPLLTSRYDGTGKTAVLKKFLGNKTLGDAKVPLMIICCTPPPYGELVEFRSWNPEQKHLLLSEILDASTAAPTYFPWVRVDDQWLVDGGLRANKPLVASLLAIIDLFKESVCNVHSLSIGTCMTEEKQRAPRKVPRKVTKENMGLIGLAKQGLADCVMGTQDKTPERLMEKFLGKRFLRLECPCDNIKLDDVGLKQRQHLIAFAEKTWQQSSRDILAFFQ